MSTEIENIIAEALQELTPDISERPYPTGQDTYICDMAYHALHCFSCGWTGAIFDLADLTDPAKIVTGMLFTPRIESLCPQCGRSVKRATSPPEDPPPKSHNLRLV